MSFRDRIRSSRQRLKERMNLIFDRGPEVNEDFWDDLEEALILSDVGGLASEEIVERLRDTATRQALPDAYAVLDLLAEHIEELFTPNEPDLFDENPVCVLFVGVNGAGKTTTVGKLANQGLGRGRKPLIGSADTFRAAAIEQLDVWGERSGVEVVKRERGADPASVCYDVVERAEALGSDLVLIDTSGRLHTSDELMRELQKVVNVTRKRSNVPVKTVLVIDATTGQNGLQQAREFDKALDLDGVIMTKLDGTAKGGIAVAVSHELGLPICRVGVGEGIEDLQPFVAKEYAEALFGEMRDGDGDNDGGDPDVAVDAGADEHGEPAEDDADAEVKAENIPEGAIEVDESTYREYEQVDAADAAEPVEPDAAGPAEADAPAEPAGPAEPEPPEPDPAGGTGADDAGEDPEEKPEKRRSRWKFWRD